jgi:integrase
VFEPKIKVDRTMRNTNTTITVAAWLLAGGADLQVVKERLGHGSIKTTERYLHTLPDADDAALAAFERTRRRRAAT